MTGLGREAIWEGQEALLEGQEKSRGPAGGPGGVGMPSQSDGSCWKGSGVSFG